MIISNQVASASEMAQAIASRAAAEPAFAERIDDAALHVLQREGGTRASCPATGDQAGDASARSDDLLRARRTAPGGPRRRRPGSGAS